MRSFGKGLFLFLFGGCVYYMMEILYRGYSHWSMILVGGIAFICIGEINEYLSWKTPLWKQCGIATVIVLLLEFFAGCIINLQLGWNVWNYSQEPFNILGQVCLGYAVLWYFLSVIGIVTDDLLRWSFFGEKFEGYKIF